MANGKTSSLFKLFGERIREDFNHPCCVSYSDGKFVISTYFRRPFNSHHDVRFLPNTDVVKAIKNSLSSDVKSAPVTNAPDFIGALETILRSGYRLDLMFRNEVFVASFSLLEAPVKDSKSGECLSSDLVKAIALAIDSHKS